MQTVDLVIGGLGVVAIIATTLGVVFYEEAAGEQTVIFPEGVIHTHPVMEEFSAVSAGTHTYETDLRNNATAFRNVAITIASSAAPNAAESGGSYEVRIIPPTSGISGCEPKQAAWAQEATIRFNECRWADPPASFETTDFDGAGNTTVWTEPLQIEITITDPSSALPVGGTTFTYDIEISYEEIGYAKAVQRPDVVRN